MLNGICFWKSELFDRYTKAVGWPRKENQEVITTGDRAPRVDIAILIGDPCHGKVVGARLLKISLRIAKIRAFKTLRGTVSKKNEGMFALRRKLGFKISSSADAGEMESTIDLKSNKF